MQQICALLSEGSLTYKIWKNNAYASPGQVVDIKSGGLDDFFKSLVEKDIDLRDSDFKLAISNSEFVLKSSDTSDEIIIEELKRVQVLWTAKSIAVNNYPDLGIKCAYQYNQSLIKGLQASGLDVTIAHYVPVLIYGISQLENVGNNLYCAVTDGRASLIYLIDERIAFVNNFEIHFPEDILYFLRLAAEQAGKKLNETDVHFIGRVQKDSELSRVVSPFLKSLNFVGEGEDEYIFKDISWIKECV